MEQYGSILRKHIGTCIALADQMEAAARTKKLDEKVEIPVYLARHYAAAMRKGIQAIQGMQLQFMDTFAENKSCWDTVETRDSAFLELLGIETDDIEDLDAEDYQKLKRFCETKGIPQSVKSFYDTLGKEN